LGSQYLVAKLLRKLFDSIDHEGPYGEGHLGDLPALYVGTDGKTALPVLATRLKIRDMREGPFDNYPCRR
jgi:Cu/Zn superoxide dismutase